MTSPPVLGEFEQDIRTTETFWNKAKNLRRNCKMMTVYDIVSEPLAIHRHV